VTLTDSTVSGNTAEFVTGAGGGIFNIGMLMITNSTISDNSASLSGGGIANSEFECCEQATLTLTNSTVSGNFAGETGGGILNRGTLTFANSTISRNTSGDRGSAIYVDWRRAPPFELPVRAANTLIDGECDQFESATVVWISRGNNIESPGDTCGFDQTSDQPGVTAEQLNLGPLADNGGPTMTHALLREPDVSVAIDAIPAADCVDADGQPLTTDQRGLPRPAGDGCDVGAFEVQLGD
jgi:hypothetical protein